MKNLFFISVIVIMAITGCTKTIQAPPAAAPGPTLTYKSYSILTIGDSIKNVTAILPFTSAATNYLNYLDPNISAVQCYTTWNTISATGQPLEMGTTAQATPEIAASLQNSDGFSSCIMLQYQNQETDYYTDGTAQQFLKGAQYYAIVKVQ